METIDAIFSSATGAYTVRNELTEYTSLDGNDWLDQFGNAPDNDIFHSLQIRLVGGPRDGECVV